MGGDSIFFREGEDRLVELRARNYDSESVLQELLAAHPSLLAGGQIDPEEPRRWLLIRREMLIPVEEDDSGRWRVDHLLVDHEGVPTLIEVKQSGDADSRRKVVGQMLDYAANAVVYLSIDAIRQAFEERCAEAGLDPDGQLADILAEGWDAGTFWEQVKVNLRGGRIRLVFVADEIPVELRRIVEFLNEQTDPAEILAVEVKQFTADGVNILVPRVYGATSAAEARKHPKPARPWDEDTFFAELTHKQGEAAVRVARQLLQWATRRMSRVWWGRGKVSGSFLGVIEHPLATDHVMSVYTDGLAYVLFRYLKKRPPFSSESLRCELLDRLTAVPGLKIDRNPHRDVRIELARLADHGALSSFLHVLDWAVNEIERHHRGPAQTGAVSGPPVVIN